MGRDEEEEEEEEEEAEEVVLEEEEEEVEEVEGEVEMRRWRRSEIRGGGKDVSGEVQTLRERSH